MTLCAQHSQPILQHIPSTSDIIASNLTNVMRGKAFIQSEVKKKKTQLSNSQF